MNATQGKALLTATTNFLAMFDPRGELPELSELRAAIEQASVTTARAISGKVNQRNAWLALASAEYRAWVLSGETVADFHNRQNAYYARVASPRSENIVKAASFDAKAYAKKMERCACGHMASDHAKDELENLLKCSDCNCGHFHYEVIAEQDAA